MKGDESGVTRARARAVTRYVTVIDFLRFSGFVRISKLRLRYFLRKTPRPYVNPLRVSHPSRLK